MIPQGQQRTHVGLSNEITIVLAKEFVLLGRSSGKAIKYCVGGLLQLMIEIARPVSLICLVKLKQAGERRRSTGQSTCLKLRLRAQPAFLSSLMA